MTMVLVAQVIIKEEQSPLYADNLHPMRRNVGSYTTLLNILTQALQ
jgi:hypothetical protein